MAQHHRTGRRQRADESDDQLCDRVRRGDDGAFGELYRRHRKAAEATARCFVRSRTDADDIVSDAFAGVLSAMRNGHGPRDNFRRYLLACVRNGCRVRPRNVPVAPEDHRLEARPSGDGPILEDPERYVEADTVARAFSNLSPRWQHMLWSTAVEQRSAQELGELLGMSPNAAAALAHRAREAFATAYLGEHLGSASSPECSDFVPHLAAYVRDQLPPGRSAAVGRHVEHCLTCSAAVADLRDVNASLRTLVPVPGALIPTAVPIAAPPSVSTGAASAGLSFTGLAMKGLVGALLVAPFLLVRSTGFDGGIADGLRRPVLPVETVTGGPSTTEVAPPPPPTPLVGRTTDPLAAVEADDVADVADVSVVTDVSLTTSPGPAPVEAAGPAERRGGVGSSSSGGSARSSTPSPSATVAAEGLLGTLGVDDALAPAGLDVVPDTVDAIVYALTADVVAPVLASAVGGLGLPLDLSALPPIPGVVVVPPPTTAPGEPAGDAVVPVTTPMPSTPAPAIPSPPPIAAGTTVPTMTPTPTNPPVTAPPTTTPATVPQTTSPGPVCDVLDLLGLCPTG